MNEEHAYLFWYSITLQYKIQSCVCVSKVFLASVGVVGLHIIVLRQLHFTGLRGQQASSTNWFQSEVQHGLHQLSAFVTTGP